MSLVVNRNMFGHKADMILGVFSPTSLARRWLGACSALARRWLGWLGWLGACSALAWRLLGARSALAWRLFGVRGASWAGLVELDGAVGERSEPKR